MTMDKEKYQKSYLRLQIDMFVLIGKAATENENLNLKT